MREDEQRFEELEAKLAALSSQVEGLELEKEVDPFLEDDVRRLIEDFREKEIAELEESDDADSDSEDFQDAGFISVQRTQDPSFKVHWITPESCDNLTKETARDAFIAGAAERFGTSQQVHAGDVLILLCRKPIPESGSEPTNPEKFCHYIGMASNTFTTPSSAEPDTSTESKITDKVGNYEIFVWSSCECSGEEPATVILPSIFEASSGSATHGNYASIGSAASPDISSAEGLLTEASLRKSTDTSSSNLAKGLDNTLSKNDAGYKAKLIQLSQDLSRYHLDQTKKQLHFEADKKNLNTHEFDSDLFVSKNLELSNGDCGNLSTVSISGETFDLALLKEGDGTLDSTFVTAAKVSLGAGEDIDGTFNLDVYDTSADDLDSDLGLADGSTVFLPIIAETAADEIANADTLDTAKLSLLNASVTGDGENFTVSISTEITTQTANYSSGLLTHKDEAVTAAGPSITFNIPDREISLANLTSLGNPGPAGHYLKQLSELRASGGYDSSGKLTLDLEFDGLRSLLNFTDHGLYDSESTPESITQALGTISIAPMSIGTFPDIGAETTDNLITQISGISSTEDLSHSVSGEKKLNLSGDLAGKQYTFNKGILTQVGGFNSQGVNLGSIIVPSGDASTNGTNTDHAPDLFKTSVNLGSPSAFYQKSVSIYSSSQALIDFVDGVAMSIHNPNYSLVSSLNLDASNNNGSATVTKLTDISVRGVYDVINESEGTGDARYYVYYTYEDVTLTIQNGLVTGSNTGSSQTFTEGPIIVPGTEIRYGCHPDYGCQLDAAGDYTEPSCGGGCTAEELILSYRPAKVWIYEPSSFDDGEFCYEFVSDHEITEPAAPLENNLANQYYTNGGHFVAESDGAGGQVDNFYVNGSLIPSEKVFFAEKDYSEMCYEHQYTQPYFHIAEQVNDPSQHGGICYRHISTHELIPAQSDDRVLVYTDGVEKLSFPNNPKTHIISRWYLNGKLISRDEYSIKDSIHPTPNWPFSCVEVEEIDYFAIGGSSAFTDSINFAETESDAQVSVSVTYADMSNAAGSNTHFYDSSGTELLPLESYVYSEGNDPVRWTIEIPAGSTSLEVHQNTTGTPGSSDWTMELEYL